MNQQDFSDLVSDVRFSPFIIVMTDGFAIAVTEDARRHMIVGKRLVVMLDTHGDLVHIPYRSIAHIQEPQDRERNQ